MAATPSASTGILFATGHVALEPQVPEYALLDEVACRFQQRRPPVGVAADRSAANDGDQASLRTGGAPLDKLVPPGAGRGIELGRRDGEES